MARTQRVNYELWFKSNTQEIKKNVNELAENLKKISNIEIGLKGSGLDDARKAAQELTLELQKAVNVDTGRLDLNKLTSNLSKGKKDVVSLSAELLKAGPIGQKSFLQIAQAISQAEVPMVKINQGLKNFMDNLGKTAKWQIAQTAIQGVQSNIQNAVREAEQLNKALNDIRIVTGLDQNAMAKFAKEANKVAKELKTTTKEYAEASLIFYQQGLSDAEVAKRAETVIKMSQVTGDTAKAVSDQMTAIWNNFADGTKSLEYYSDAMAKLGAETAASTSEIANSLEKFAAIAGTVGLSYETAMASVATVIDKTRQSADVVGTAFKTIFARVQGLSLDGVTDDGVSLNKYSQALEKVGVDVLTASGELRAMDDILSDLGEKWQLLGKEQQVAVAQVVGGARQYNQLLSLMDNWSDVQKNIIKAEGSTGEISKQANIWADSYEAAAKRVEEAKARVSENFLNSEDVVALTNAFADLITWVDKFIDSFGGIIPLGLTITGMFSGKIIPIAKTGLTALGSNIKTVFGNMLGTSEQTIKNTQNAFNDFLESYKNGGIEDSLKAQVEWNQKLIKIKQEMAETTKYMSEQEKERALSLLAVYEENVGAAIQAQEAFREAEFAQKKSLGAINTEEMKSAVSTQFFKEEGIEDEGKQNAIREAAQKDVSKKLQLINQKGTIQKNLDEQQFKLEELQSLYDEKKKEYDKAVSLKASSERKIKYGSDTSHYKPKARMVKREQEINKASEETIQTVGPELDALEKEIEKALKGVGKISKQLTLAETYEEDKEVLEQAKRLQERRQSVTTREGIQTASFGSTQFAPDDSVTLNEDQRKLYNAKFTQAQQEQIKLHGKEVGLQFDEKGLKNSIQNYEILRSKVIEYRVEAVKTAQINAEITAELNEEEKEYIAAQDARMKANLEKQQASEQVTQAQKNESEAKDAERVAQLAFDSATTEEQKVQAQIALEEAQKKVAASIEETAKAQKAHAAATEKSTKAQERFQKAEEKISKASKKTFKVLKENRDALIEIAKKAGLSEQELTEFVETLDSVEDIKGFDKIRQQLKNFEITTRETANTLGVLAENVQEALELGIGADKILKLAEAYGITEKEALKLAIAQEKAKRAAEEFENKITNFGNGFESIVSGVSQATAALASLNAGVNQIFDVFTEAGTPLEKFTGFLGGLISTAPAAIATIKAIGAAQKWATKTAEAARKEDKKDFLSWLAVKLTGNLAAGVGSFNPAKIAAALAGIAIAATIGLSVQTNRNANKKEQQQETNNAAIEAAQKSNEAAEAVKTESNAIDELVTQYNKLSDAEKASSKLKDDIISQVDKVIEKYREYAKTLDDVSEVKGNLNSAIQELETAQLLGDLEGIQKAQEKADLIVAKEAQSKNKLGIAGELGNATINDQARDVKYNEKGNYIHRQVGGAGKEEEEANKILQEELGEERIKRSRDRGTNIKLRTTDAETFIGDYEALQRAVNRMLSDSDENISNPGINDTLRECNELLSDYKETYESLKSQVASGASYNAQIAMGSVDTSVSDIKSYSDYTAYKKSVQTNIANNGKLTDTEKQQAKESLDTQLSMNSELKVFSDLEKKFKAIYEEGTDVESIITNILEKVNNDDAVLEVNLSVYHQEQEIIDEANRIKERLEREKIETKIGVYADIKEVLKPTGMTEEDWTKISENELFKDNPEEFKRFIGLSYAEQMAEITKAENDLHKNRQATLEKEIASYKATISDTTSSATAKEEARRQVELLTAQLEIIKKVRQENDLYMANVRKSDIADIYHDINQELEKLEKHYQKIQEIQDKVYGTEALKLYDDLLDNLIQQNEQLEYQATLSRNEAKAERNELTNKYKKDYGVDLAFDADGNLTNYNEVIEKLMSLGGSKEDIEALREQWTSDYGNYTSAQNKALEDEEKIAANKRQQQEVKLQKITSKVDLVLEIRDTELKKIKYDVDKAMDNMFTEADFSKVTTGLNEQMNLLSHSYNAITEEIGKLDAALIAEEITEAQYIERMTELQDESLNCQQALDELANSMIQLYSTNLKKAEAEISKYTSQMDHLTSVTNHYKTLFDLLGESAGEGMREVLSTQKTLAKNNFDVSKQIYTEYAANAEIAEKAYNDYLEKKGDSLDKANDKEYQALEEAWLASREAANKAQEDMLADAAAWGEAMKAEIEFNLQSVSKSLEADLTGGIGFEQLTAQMSRRSTLQEEILTATNRTYEIEKMSRDISNSMLKTESTRAKQKLKAFQDETKQLNSNNKLTKVELDIQQKKYELLLAEIALEDAQNAKSTVRLTRTADGGFGYVYTADENAVNDAEQNYADAENTLYNTRLEAANTYTEKRVQIQQELNQELQALAEQYKNGEIESYEMYLELQNNIIQDYQNLYDTYSDIYQVAVTEDSQVATDAWSSSVATLLETQKGFDTETGAVIEGFAGRIQQYQDEVNEQINTWDSLMTKFKDAVGLNLGGTNTSIDGTDQKIDGLSKKLQDMTTDSNNLKTALIGTDGKSGVVGAMDKIIDAGADFLTGNGPIWLKTIQKLGSYFGTLSDNIASTVSNASGLGDLTLPPTEEPAPPPTPNPNTAYIIDEGKKEFAEEGDTFESGYATTWEKAYNAALSGQAMTYTPDYSKTKAENQGIEQAISDATKLAQSHLAEGGLTASSSLKAGEISISGQNDLSSQINTDYATQLAKAQSGQRTETSFAYQAPVSAPTSPSQSTTLEEFSWQKVLKSWKENGSDITYNKNGKETTVTLEDYYKQYGVDLKVGEGQAHYGDDDFATLTAYFNSLGINENSNASAFKYEDYESVYFKDIASQIEKGNKGLAIQTYLEQHGIENEAISTALNNRLTSEEKRFLSALLYLKGYNGFTTLYEELKSEAINNPDSLPLEKFKQYAPTDLIFSLAKMLYGDWSPSTIYYQKTNWRGQTIEDKANYSGQLNNVTPSDIDEDNDRIYINNTSFYFKRADLLGHIGFKTGGYTGSWGPEGKMAVLHEKEIVLNKEDTVNLLDSIKLLRSILNAVDIQAANAQFSSLSSGSLYNSNSSKEILEQNVHIEAHFDNVSDRNEIVEAFNTLINQASQYANRKK